MTFFQQRLRGLEQFFQQVLFGHHDGHVFAILRVRDFRNLWTGQMISFLGDALAYNTLTLTIIRTANDADVSAGRILSLLFVLSALPSLLFGMVAGTIVDRGNRKTIMIAADIIRGFLALGFLTVREIDQVWILIVVSVLLSTVSTFFFPARTALLPMILTKEQLLAANSVAQLTHTLSFVVGAAAAGVLVGSFNATAPAFVVDSLSFFVSAFFIARIGVSGKVVQQHPATSMQPGADRLRVTLAQAWATLRAMGAELIVGLRYVLTDPIMRGVLISFLALMLGLGAANVTFVPLLINELGMREEGLGLIRLSQTIGIMIGSALVASAFIQRHRPGLIIGGSMVLFGMMTIIVSVTTGYGLMVLVLFLVGLTISPPQIVASTMMQQHVPREKLGRASGAQGTIVNVANISSMGAAGLLMDQIGARAVFSLAGMLIAVAGVVSWWGLRDIGAGPTNDPAPSSLIAETPADR